MKSFCERCGKPLNPEARFCGYCGTTASGGSATADLPESVPNMRGPLQSGTASTMRGLGKGALWLAVLAVLVWLYASPYVAVRNMRQAAMNGNVEELKYAADFPALRASLKEELDGQISKQTVDEIKKDSNGFAALGSALVGGFVNLMIDQLVTPQAIASIVQGKRLDGTPDKLSAAIERFSPKPQSRGSEPSADTSNPETTISEGYESLSQFVVKLSPANTKVSIKLVWIRSGLTSWRLSAIRLPDFDELTKTTDESNAGPSTRANLQQTTTPRTAAMESVAVPFVGCQSDGQVGPMKAPSGSDFAIEAEAVAQRLAYYKSESGPGILAPRDWYCFGTYGSSGDTLYVSPQPIDSAMFSTDGTGFTGAAIEIARLYGGTSGRFGVARIIALVFPAHRSFVTKVIDEGIEPATSFPFGPYPLDKLIYRSNEMVEYQTPAQAEGLGTASWLKRNDTPIDGAVILTGEDPDLLQLSLRLPPGLNDLTPVIIRQVELDTSRK